MRLVALKLLPNGVPAGASFDENPIVGGLLIQAGAARAFDESDRPRLIKRRKSASLKTHAPSD